MRTLTVRLTDALAAEIDAESRRRRVSKSDVVRQRLSAGATTPRPAASLEFIRDLIGSVKGLPADLSARKKHYLRKTGYDHKHSRCRPLPRCTSKPAGR